MNGDVNCRGVVRLIGMLGFNGLHSQCEWGHQRHRHGKRVQNNGKITAFNDSVNGGINGTGTVRLVQARCGPNSIQ